MRSELTFTRKKQIKWSASFKTTPRSSCGWVSIIIIVATKFFFAYSIECTLSHVCENYWRKSHFIKTFAHSHVLQDWKLKWY